MRNQMGNCEVLENAWVKLVKLNDGPPEITKI